MTPAAVVEAMVRHSSQWELVAAFAVWGKPKAQPRGRATIRGKHAGIYDPGTADGWKALVVAAGESQRPAVPLGGPVRLDIHYLMPRPIRLMRMRDPDGEVLCDTKPDRDNLSKALADALTNAGWWRDDCQVCFGVEVKLYHAKDGAAGARVAISVPSRTVITSSPCQQGKKRVTKK